MHDFSPHNNPEEYRLPADPAFDPSNATPSVNETPMTAPAPDFSERGGVIPYEPGEIAAPAMTASDYSEEIPDDAHPPAPAPPPEVPALGSVSLSAEARAEQAATPVEPIRNLTDVMSYGQSIINRPSEGYYALSNTVYDSIAAVETLGYSPALQEDLAHTVALRDALSLAVLEPNTLDHEWGRKPRMAAHHDETLTAHGASFAAVEARAGELSTDETLDYFMDTLESYTAYLETGEQPTNWPGAAAQGGLLSHGALQRVQQTAELLHVSLDLLQQNLSDGGTAIADRLGGWVDHTTETLLNHRHVGIAVPLINTAPSEVGGRALVARLTDAMNEVRNTEGDNSYRSLYSFAAHMLREPLNNAFIEQNARIRSEPILGAKRELHDSGGTQILSERFPQNVPIEANLAGGDTTTLPYERYTVRTLYNYDTVRERELYEADTAVSYEDLPDAAKLAVEEAWRAADLEQLREETLPHYQRLAFKPGKQLHTVAFRDGYGRRIHHYPDDHGFVTSDTEPHIDRPVVSVRPVLDTYMAVPYRDDYAAMTTYLDTEPNIFGPGEDRANAFWIAGEPRIVYDQSGNPKYMKQGSHSTRNDTARWVVMPVRYYQVETQPRPPAEDEDRRFF